MYLVILRLRDLQISFDVSTCKSLNLNIPKSEIWLVLRLRAMELRLFTEQIMPYIRLLFL